MSPYLSELRQNWRPLLAATIGIGTGTSIAGTVTSVIAPHLIADVGWSLSEFALVGSLGIASTLAFPFVGRLADVLGVRKTALIGQIALPLLYLAYSMMSGAIGVYIALYVFQCMVCVTTTATVYTRLPVQYVRHARGMALAIVASGPAITSAIGGPILNGFVESHGWRASYQALAVFAVVAGIVTFLLIPREPDVPANAPARRRASEDYPRILRSPAFWVLAVAMLLCNLPQVVMLTQLKLILLANGVTGQGAAVMFSALAIGMLAGRFLTGIFLDRFSPYAVSFLTLGLPSLGLFVVASGLDGPTVLTLAVFFLGFGFGAEGDIIAYLVARLFGVRIYSSVLGLLTAVISVSASAGAGLLGWTLATTGSFDGFLVGAGVAVFCGATLLLFAKRVELKQDEAVQDSVPIEGEENTKINHA